MIPLFPHLWPKAAPSDRPRPTPNRSITSILHDEPLINNEHVIYF